MAHDFTTDNLAQQWARAIGRETSGPPAGHGLPSTSEELLAEVRSPQGDRDRLRQLAERHGDLCATFADHTVEEVVAEFAALRSAVGDGDAAVHDRIDLCIAAAVRAFVAARAELHRAEAEEGEELADAVRVRDDFLSMVSHELRTPLSALLLQLQLLARTAKRQPDGVPTPAAVAHTLPRAIQLTDRMTAMLDRLLDLSRIRTDRFGLEVTPVDLCGLLHEQVARLGPRAEEAGATLVLHTCAELFANVDPLRIEQVLTNLITNAVKYGGREPIEITLRREATDAVIEVRDRGDGIAPGDQERIFERWVRASRAHGKHSLGLGLYITREIVRAHGGRIEVESEEGAGSTFKVTLPTHRIS